MECIRHLSDFIKQKPKQSDDSDRLLQFESAVSNFYSGASLIIAPLSELIETTLQHCPHWRLAKTSPNSATVAVQRQSPFSVTVSENGYCLRIRRLWPKTATVAELVVSVDRA